MVKKGGFMKVRLKVDVMRDNLEVIRDFADKRGVGLSFMIKHQFGCDFIDKLLKGEHVYTNKSVSKGWENIYLSNRITIVDAFENREGITLSDANIVENKDIAIVNFSCCSGLQPLCKDLQEITRNLHILGFKKVSLGGSILLSYDSCYKPSIDEIRIGEALLTGYSSYPLGRYFDGLTNPFEMDLDVWSSSKHGVVVRHGFLDLGGFTDIKTKCVNTDFSVLDVKDWRKYKKGDVITVKPDYYTLIKIASHWREWKVTEYDMELV